MSLFADQTEIADVPQFYSRKSDHAARDGIPPVVFIWDRFGPYHVDRCEAAAERLSGRAQVYGVEIASFDDTYKWEESRSGSAFSKITLFPHRTRSTINPIFCFFKLLSVCLRLRAKYLFVCNYEDPIIFFLSIVLRLLNRRVFIMQDSKFDDKQRVIWWELFKYLVYAPYSGALVGSRRTASYLKFLGVPAGRIFLGYDTVSVDRIRTLSGSQPAPGGLSHSERHFTIIARFVPKKNLSMAISAYAAYVASNPPQPRELHLVGSGELEGELRAQCEQLGLTTAKFLGFLQEKQISQVLASTLALILPSIEEQFGLVINEAVAMGVPVLLSDNCGARDLLVRSTVNGYIFEADNPAGLTHFISLLASDPEEWTRLCHGARRFFTDAADTRFFAEAVDRALACYTSCEQIVEPPTAKA